MFYELKLCCSVDPDVIFHLTFHSNLLAMIIVCVCVINVYASYSPPCNGLISFLVHFAILHIPSISEQ